MKSATKFQEYLQLFFSHVSVSLRDRFSCSSRLATERDRMIEDIKTQFSKSLGYELDLRQPRTFNEKIQWLKLNYRDELMTQCADKYRVRDYVRETIGEEYLIPLLGVHDFPDDIDFHELPDRFVLKTNHGSGQNIICRDKTVFNEVEAKQKFREWIKPESNHYFYSYEWCYKDIPPKIVIEKYIAEAQGDDVVDYKFMCFGGVAKMVFTCSERSEGELKVDFFDLSWNHLPFTRHYPNAKHPPKKPERLQDMIVLAEKLSAPFPFVRVDFYEIRGKIFFGELTFYPGNGMEEFSPFEWDVRLGDLLMLSEKS